MSAQARDIGDYYRDFSVLYDELSRGVPGDIDFYVDLARDADGEVVELGIGTGRIAIPAAQAGARILGVDREPAMLAVAEQKAREAGVADRIRLVEGDMRTFTVDAPVSLVMIPFRTFLHNLSEADQLDTLAACRRALRPGGRLVLNVFNPDLALIARRMQEGGKRWEPFGQSDRSQGQHHYDPGSQQVTTVVRARGPGGDWRRTAFTLLYVHREDMEALLDRSGFDVEALFGGFDREPFGEGSAEMVWVAHA